MKFHDLAEVGASVGSLACALAAAGTRRVSVVALISGSFTLLVPEVARPACRTHVSGLILKRTGCRRIVCGIHR